MNDATDAIVTIIRGTSGLYVVYEVVVSVYGISGDSGIILGLSPLDRQGTS